ncbi:ABC transporter ATP-binding protein [Halieaceae bacterium IMCC14734]|uniref:ABC transporter ATP-binding protein n=1 Tax=Candidatus Litorirhabdus singularis TaxID=2518993 RepID=A0ABT3TMW9_9GAMM|nr:ABC transporter ATP-binding protein [Candidatus Litorirhabdus singularis]MCX2983374.1 ABC transporter ATP-binding protein [Candidatus Litorirhabdus singularis]
MSNPATGSSTAPVTGHAPEPPVQARIKWSALTRFLGHFLPYRRQVILGLCLIPVSVTFSIMFPWLIMQVIDEQLVPGRSEGLLLMCGALAAVLVGNYIADAVFSYSLQSAAQYAIRDIRGEMFRRVLQFPRHYFDRTPMGVTLTRLTSDLEAISESFAQGLLSMIRDVLVTLALLVFLMFISWKLTLVLLLIGPLIYYITEVLRRRLRDSYLQARVVLSEGTGYLQECLSGIKTVQLYNAEADVQQRYATYTKDFYHAQSRSNLYDSSLYSLIEGITTVSMGLIIWYGSKEILAASLTVGVLVGFISTLDKIFVPIRDFTSQMAAIQRAFAAFDHIEDIYQQDTESEDDVLIARLSPAEQAQLLRFDSVVFEQVSFRYTQAGPYVLRGVSFSLNKGDKIALVGSTGSGKSTIMRLLTRTYVNYEGSIKLNGVELNRIPKPEVAKFFSLMQQEVFLFNESIEFNIGLQRETNEADFVQSAARYVYADAFIERLPGQYQFVLQGNGDNLSAGQAQLIAFARAIAGGSEVVMLDEATSSVDSVTEELIQKAIDHVFEDKTVIAIAHRLSTIAHSDQILVLDQGVIIERGTHAALMAEAGFYANLVRHLDQEPEH